MRFFRLSLERSFGFERSSCRIVMVHHAHVERHVHWIVMTPNLASVHGRDQPWSQPPGSKVDFPDCILFTIQVAGSFCAKRPCYPCVPSTWRSYVTYGFYSEGFRPSSRSPIHNIPEHPDTFHAVITLRGISPRGIWLELTAWTGTSPLSRGAAHT